MSITAKKKGTPVSEKQAMLNELAAVDAQRTAILNKYRHLHQYDTAGPRIPLCVVIREHLLSKGGGQKIKDLTADLMARGFDLGKYPLRTVKVATVMPTTKHLFSIAKDADNEEVVSVQEAYGEIAYTSTAQRQQAKTSRLLAN